MTTQVNGDQRSRIYAKLFEIGRQVFLQKEYAFDPEELDRFLQRGVEGRFHQVQRCHEKEGVIYFEVISDGTTGPVWIERLENKGFRISKWAKDVLNSKDFKSTSGVNYKIAVLKGTMFSNDDRITSKIRVCAEDFRTHEGNKLEKPNAEIACLIREMFSDEELKAMGLWWIVVFHEPIKDSDGDPYLLAARRDHEGRWLSTYSDRPDGHWYSDDGFAFVVSQVYSS